MQSTHSLAITRRQFLKTTAAATLALGSSRGNAATTTAYDLVDTNVSLGRWPFRRLAFDDTSDLVAKLRKHGVGQAWVANLDGMFGKDIGAVNNWLVRECEKRGRNILVPFGTVNLALPNWKAEFQRCCGDYKMPGLRLYPNYHRYKLSDADFAKLMSLAVEHRIIVQIAVSMEDERTQPPSAQTPHVEVKPLLAMLKSSPIPRVVLLNWYRAVKPDLVKELAELGVCFDMATVENVGGVANLAEQISTERVLFGSHTPLFYFESAQFKLKESALEKTDLRAISEQNARRLLSR
jgi:predicted TIM-barrel fold metal-dependent hydrolase